MAGGGQDEANQREQDDVVVNGMQRAAAALHAVQRAPPQHQLGQHRARLRRLRRRIRVLVVRAHVERARRGRRHVESKEGAV